MKLQGAGFRTSEVKMLRTHVVASASFVAHSRQREFSSNRLIVAGSPFTLE
jgi:hypothetical protein